MARQPLDFNDTDIFITVRTGEDSQVVWVDEGSSYVIRCIAPGGGPVEWTALDGQILNEDGNGLLRINGASASSVGLFRCHWQSDHSSSVAVDVRLSSSRKGTLPDTVWMLTRTIEVIKYDFALQKVAGENYRYSLFPNLYRPSG